MKPSIRTLFILSCSILLSSCTPIILKLIGAKQPEVESFESIKAHAKKWDINQDSVFIMKEDYVLSRFSGTNINQKLLFDKNGYSIDLTKVWKKAECKGNIYALLKGLGKVTYAERDSSTLLKETIDKAFHLNTKKEPVIDFTNDYYIVFYWNCFMGPDKNKNEIELLRKYIAENPRIKTQLILINSDMYEGVDWEQKLKQDKAMVSP
jgi:hypothetical protein